MNQPSIKTVENILKGILLAALFITPLIYLPLLYFPYVAGKAYFFRLLIELALIPWIILLIRKPESRPNLKNPLIVALLMLAGALILTAITGINVRQSFFSTMDRSDGIFQYLLLILFFLMSISVFKKKKDWQILIAFFILAALINCVYGLINIKDQPRLFGLLGNSSFLGGFLIFAIGFCFLFLTNSFTLSNFSKKNLGGLVLGLVLLFTIALVLTQTRGAFAGVFLGFLIFVAFSSFYLWKNNKRLAVGLSILLIAVLAGLALLFVFKDSSFIKKYPILSRVAHTFQSTSATDRLSEWQTAIKGFKDKPIFGWGPENFDVVANKYYDYRVGLYEPWFDRPHNQALQYLAEGGIVLFAAYLFLVAMVFRLIFKIFRKEKILGSLLFAVYVAYIVQSLILFDVLPILIGLFVLFGLVYFFTEALKPEAKLYPKNQPVLLGIVALGIVLLIYFSVWVPLRGNLLIIKALKATMEATILGNYKNLSITWDKLFHLRSPYLYRDIRKAVAFDFVQNFLDRPVESKHQREIMDLYKKLMPEVENWKKYRPTDPQVYYVLGAGYRRGYEKLGVAEDLIKAEQSLKEALKLSPVRIEYIEELGQVLFSEGKYDELLKLTEQFSSELHPDDSYRYLSIGNVYFRLGKYELAFEQYEKARALGQTFWNSERDYYRYMKSAEQITDWQKVVEMAQARLKEKGEDADTLFNLAVAQLYLGDKESAKINFEKAVKIDSTFEQYRSFFQ